MGNNRKKTAAKKRLLNKLGNYPHEATIGFLKREGLPVDKQIQSRIQKVNQAIMNDIIPDSHLRNWLRELTFIDESMEYFKDFHVQLPKISAFCQKKKLTANAPLAMLEQQVKNELYKDSFPLKDWVDHLDGYRENSMQYIFPFYLEEQHVDYLNNLRNPDFLKNCLKKANLRSVYNKSEFSWRSLKPKLANIIHSNDFLKMKWVETRNWKQNNIKRRERTLKFFRLNLRNGNCELRIQRLKSGQGGKSRLKKEFEELRNQVAGIIDFMNFKPLLLEPAIRRLLVSEKMTLNEWSVELAKGGILRGMRDPTLFNYINLFFQRFYAFFIKGDWKDKNGNRIPVEFEGKNDLIYLRGECKEKQVESLLTEVRFLSKRQRFHFAKIKNGEKAKKEREKKLTLPQMKIFEYMRTLGQAEIPVTQIKQLASEMWLPARGFKELFRNLESQPEKKFKITYFIRCPETQIPAKSKGRIEYFEHLEDIPGTLPCDNRKKGRPIVKPRDTNTILSLKKAPVEIPKPVGIRFLAVFCPLVLLTTLALLFMLTYFHGILQNTVIVATYLFLLVVEMAVAIETTGRGNLEFALKLVTVIWKHATRKPGP